MEHAWSFIYQIILSAGKSVSEQMNGFYKNSYVNDIVNYDQMSLIQI